LGKFVNGDIPPSIKSREFNDGGIDVIKFGECDVEIGNVSFVDGYDKIVVNGTTSIGGDLELES
jgi:hypothetical protein